MERFVARLAVRGRESQSGGVGETVGPLAVELVSSGAALEVPPRELTVQRGASFGVDAQALPTVLTNLQDRSFFPHRVFPLQLGDELRDLARVDEEAGFGSLA